MARLDTTLNMADVAKSINVKIKINGMGRYKTRLIVAKVLIWMLKKVLPFDVETEWRG